MINVAYFTYNDGIYYECWEYDGGQYEGCK